MVARNEIRFTAIRERPDRIRLWSGGRDVGLLIGDLPYFGWRAFRLPAARLYRHRTRRPYTTAAAAARALFGADGEAAVLRLKQSETPPLATPEAK